MQSDPARAVPPESDLLRKITDTVPAMLAYWDASLYCKFANKAYEHWFGVSPESLIGTHIRDLLGPLYPLNLPYIEGALRGEPQQFEREIPDPQGGSPRQSLAEYIPDVVDGVVQGFTVMVTDISSVKRAELALRESEERFRLTLDEAPIGMAMVATDGRFMRVNRALCELVGYPAQELTGLTFQAITHPEDLDADLTLATQLARGEIPRYQLEKRYIRKDGSLVDIMLHGSALRGPDGDLRHFIAQIEDITEQKRLERDQRFLAEAGPILASTLDYERTLTSVADLAVQRLADFCIVDLVERDDHEQVRRLRVASRDPSKRGLARTMAEMPIDRSKPYLLYEAFQERRTQFLQRPTSTALAAVSQTTAHHRSLMALEIESLVAVPLCAHERLLGVMAFVSSTPGRSYGPAEVRLAEELAQRAALAIENAQLYRAAQRAMQARDDVLGVVAHDLRNPVHNIVTRALLLQQCKRPTAPQVGASAATIERTARRMDRLIQDLLDVVQAEAGVLTITPAAISPAQIVGDLIESQEPLASAASLDLETELMPDLPEVWADAGRMLQALENLVGNAIRYTPSGGRIRVGASRHADGVLFWVADTGVGISSEQLPHVFDRFWQAKKGQARGAGLGLPIVKGIVEAHGGQIWAESQPARGSCFFFTIPTAPHAEARPPRHAPGPWA